MQTPAAGAARERPPAPNRGAEDIREQQEGRLAGAALALGNLSPSRGPVLDENGRVAHIRLNPSIRSRQVLPMSRPVLREPLRSGEGAVPRWAAALPEDLEGRLVFGRPLADLTWLRVGGPAEALYQPASIRDLARFLAALPPEVPVFPIGVGSNLIVRDGGIDGVVIRLGRGFHGIEILPGGRVRAGAAALDARVALKAADAGVDLTFLRTIPGTIGGAVRMNAGCYGRYLADVFVTATAVTRAGEVVTLRPADLGFAYRETRLPADTVIVQAVLAGPVGDPAALHRRMAAQLARRDATQPTKERTAGSTFRNPAGHSSTGAADEDHSRKAWKLIEMAGMRGARRGGAMMSTRHANFLVNTGGATAADLEGLGEEVRKRVFETTGTRLEWEIMRVGRPAPAGPGAEPPEGPPEGPSAEPPEAQDPAGDHGAGDGSPGIPVGD